MDVCSSSMEWRICRRLGHLVLKNFNKTSDLKFLTTKNTRCKTLHLWFLLSFMMNGWPYDLTNKIEMDHHDFIDLSIIYGIQWRIWLILTMLSSCNVKYKMIIFLTSHATIFGSLQAITEYLTSVVLCVRTLTLDNPIPSF